jgi:hypothetical protein
MKGEGIFLPSEGLLASEDGLTDSAAWSYSLAKKKKPQNTHIWRVRKVPVHLY